MILIQGYMRTSPENAGAFRAAAAPLMAATRQEAGNIAYAFAEDVTEPGLFHLIERWEDEAAIAAHNQTLHLAAFMAAAPGLGLIGFRVARYDAASEQVLAGS